MSNDQSPRAAAATVYAVVSRVSSFYTWAMEDPDGNIADQRDPAMRLFCLLTGMRRREAEPGERAHFNPGAGLVQAAPAWKQPALSPAEGPVLG
jgi:hypothetical protein